MCNIKINKNTEGVNINACFDIYYFNQDNSMVAYVPSLDISAFGVDRQEAEKEIIETLKLHFEFCIEQGTLIDDLLQHGWSKQEEVISSPLFDRMLNTNSEFRNIITKVPNYSKTKQPVSLCL